jgi:hypothetical protein
VCIKLGLIELLPIVYESKGLLRGIVCSKAKKRLRGMLLVRIDGFGRLITEKGDSLEDFHNHVLPMSVGYFTVNF